MKQRFLLRLLMIFFAVIPLLFYKEFYIHFVSYLTGNIITDVITQQWHIVVISVAVFLIFLIPLSFRRKVNWAEHGIVTAFFVSLFIEMYGIPLTILFASNYFFTPGTLPPSLLSFEFLGVQLGMDIGMMYGAALIIMGIALIIAGWVTLYRNIKKNGIVASGIYSYSRHPQYLGFILIIVGWLAAWPTLLTLVFAPILIYRYIRVCHTEEAEMSNKFKEYESYKRTVPFFL